MPISNKQKKILAFPYTTKYQALICDGAVRSGKTSLMTVAFIDWAMREFDGCNFGICGKTVGSAIKNIVNPYLAMTYHRNKYSIKFTRSDNKLIVRSGHKSNTFYLYGGKDESSYMLIQGITLAGILLDEVALMTRSFVEQALARCSVESARFWFNCNPENPGHWFYQEWVKDAENKKALHLHFLMTDNPSLSEETLDRYNRMYSGVFHRRYVLGEWIAADGLIYDMFDREQHVVPDMPVINEQPTPRRYTQHYVSCDYGTQNATVFGLWGLCDGVWYLIKEYYYSGRDERKQKTDEQYADDYIQFVNGYKITAMIVDPSAASFIAALSQRSVPVMKADNDVLDGIRLTASLLLAGTIKICESCTKTIEEFGLYIWDKKAIGEDRPVKENDHCMDETRYFCKTVLDAGKRWYYE